MLSSAINRSGRWSMFIMLFIAFLLLGGCGSDSADTGSGEVIIGLTDAEGDYASYTVDVVSLTLTRQDGTVVETLPVNTRVDFAQYTDLTEFLTAATVPAGVYTAASMQLDYTDAQIQVEDADGDIVAVNHIVDTDGNAIHKLDMKVHLDDRDRLLIAPGVPAHLTLDFDLQASNAIDFGSALVTMTVSPFLVADVELQRPKPHRIRGPLASVDVQSQQFELILRPFHHVLVNDRRFGSLTVQTDDETVYEIDNVVYSGSEGLRKLDTMPQYTAVIAIGELMLRDNRRVYVASEVYAGSSVPGGDLDVVKGHVISRSGDSLRLKGVSLLRRDGSVAFEREVTVNLGVATVVSKQLSTATHDISDISVGQRLTVFGELDTASAGGATMDATAGYVRMHLTTLRGQVVQVDSPMALDLQSIGRHRAQVFDFSGTGVNPSNDADADFYEINTGDLVLDKVKLDRRIKVRGFVRAFGAAPEDFDAHTLIIAADGKSLMKVNWVPASDSAITSVTAQGISLDLDGTGRFHHVIQLGMRTDLTTLAASPQLVPNASSTGVFVINRLFSARVFVNFDAFSQALSSQLLNSAVRSVQAVGHFDEGTATMELRAMKVELR